MPSARIRRADDGLDDLLEHPALEDEALAGVVHRDDAVAARTVVPRALAGRGDAGAAGVGGARVDDADGGVGGESGHGGLQVVVGVVYKRNSTLALR
jgi:hypothetical protein